MGNEYWVIGDPAEPESAVAIAVGDLTDDELHELVGALALDPGADAWEAADAEPLGAMIGAAFDVEAPDPFELSTHLVLGRGKPKGVFEVDRPPRADFRFSLARLGLDEAGAGEPAFEAAPAALFMVHDSAVDMPKRRGPGTALVRLRRKPDPLRWLIGLLERIRQIRVPDPRFRTTGATYRRGFGTPPNLIFPPGMGTRWRSAQLDDGLFPRFGGVRHAFPKNLMLSTRPLCQAPWGVAAFAAALFVRKGHDTTRRGPQVMRRITERGHTRAEHRIPRLSQRLPTARDREDWLAARVLNGMAIPPLARVGETTVVARLRFSGMAVAPDHHPEAPIDGVLAPYEVPDVDITLDTSAPDRVRVTRIAVRYRDRSRAGWHLPGAAYGPWIEVDPATDPDPVRIAAVRVASSALLLAGQLDQHVALGHFIPELIDTALHVAGLGDTHPLRRVLDARLAEVALVDWNADAIIWGPDGLFPVTTGLTPKAIADRAAARLGAVDWKGYRPPSTPVHPSHTCPQVFGAYWDEAVLPWARDALDACGGTAWILDPADPWREAVDRLNDTLQRHWPRHTPWAEAPRDEVVDLARYGDARPVGAPCSRIETPEDLVQFVAFTVFHATLGHGWANVRQLVEGGDPSWSTFALRARLDDPRVLADPDGWHRAALPIANDVLFQLVIGDVLTTLPVDTFSAETRTAARPGWSALDLPDTRIDPLLRRGDGLAARFDALRDDLATIAGRDPWAGDPDLADTFLGAPDFQLSRTNR